MPRPAVSAQSCKESDFLAHDRHGLVPSSSSESIGGTPPRATSGNSHLTFGGLEGLDHGASSGAGYFGEVEYEVRRKCTTNSAMAINHIFMVLKYF